MKCNNPFGLRIHGNLPFENKEECVGISINPTINLLVKQYIHIWAIITMLNLRKDRLITFF